MVTSQNAHPRERLPDALPENREPCAIFCNLVCGKIATSWNWFDQSQQYYNRTAILLSFRAWFQHNIQSTLKSINSVMVTYLSHANICKPFDGTADIEYIVNLITKQRCPEVHFVSINIYYVMLYHLYGILPLLRYPHITLQTDHSTQSLLNKASSINW